MLETKSLSKSYIKKQVLFDLSFTITGGHIYGLLGPNGSGKSTWMKICAGLVKPTSGSVSLEGRKIDIQTRNDIAYAPTENFFYPWMSIEEVGQYYQDFFPDFSLDTYHTLLEEMKLTPKQKLKTLSSGMNAKTKIAAALSRNAKVYLLDEPFNGIDLITRDEIAKTIIQSLRQDNVIIISSHLIEEMESFIDSAIFIRDGHFLEVCDTESLRLRANKSLSDRYRELMQ
jgi:ABC transporter, ATP-binding protein